jgi:transposase InsO family protein
MARSPSDRRSHRLGTPNQHNGRIPRDFWLEDGEEARILAFHDTDPLEGDRRLADMRLDADVVAVSPSSVYRVPEAAGRPAPRGGAPSREGKGFEPPTRGHERGHVDVSSLNIRGTVSFLCSILDGESRSVVHREIRETMKEAEVETILQRARERHPGEHPRIITDNGPQFVAGDFKEFVRICGMTPVRTSPSYPPSNGKIERGSKTLKGECLRVTTPLCLEDAGRPVAELVTDSDTVRLHGAIASIAAADKLAGRAEAIGAARREELAPADARRGGKSREKELAQRGSAERQ